MTEIEKLKHRIAVLKTTLELKEKEYDRIFNEYMNYKNDELNRFLQNRNIRNIEYMCTVCQGSGIKLYGSTSTWRGGIGGAAMTRDVCDQCWGSGNKYQPWVNLKELEQVLYKNK